jgi:predicted CoA-binding protein
MSGETCPLPDRSANPQDAVRRMLAAKRIAIVGLSDDPSRPSYGVARYLQSVGKQIIPVNPKCDQVLGEKCYPTLEAIPDPVDVVDVFRRPQFCVEVVRSAIAIGAIGVWLQSGIVNEEAAEIARDAGIDFVQDRCMKVDHMYMGD